MEIDFNTFHKHIIPMEDFSLSWRFTDAKYCQLPQRDLDELKPLDQKSSEALHTHIKGIHKDFPFTKKYFSTVDEKVWSDNDPEIREWLISKGIPKDQNVYLNWDPKTSMIVPFRLLVEYFDELYYGSFDDLTIVDSTLTWALLLFHTDQFYFGAK